MERRTFFAAFVAPVLGLLGLRPRKEENCLRVDVGENVALLEIPFLTKEKDGEDLTIIFGVKGSEQVTLDVDQATATCLRDAEPGQPIDFRAVIYPRGRLLSVRKEPGSAARHNFYNSTLRTIEPGEIIFAPDRSDPFYRKFMLNEDLHGDPR